MDLVEVASGLEFPEGPIALSDGSVIVVEMKGQRVTRIAADGAREIVAQLAGGPNGAALGPDGAIYVCNNGGAFDYVHRNGVLYPTSTIRPDYTGGSIQRVDLKTGAVTTLYSARRGTPLRSPNDLVFDRNGGFWFTDHGFRRGDQLDLGALYYAASDGSTLHRARKHIISPNGVGLSPAEDLVYFADTLTARLYSCVIESPGRLARSDFVPGKVVGVLGSNQALDSLAVEENGNVCVATIMEGGISVFGSGAIEQIPILDPLTTNICFGGSDMRDAWITCSGFGKLFRCRWPRPGLRLNFSI